MNVRRSAAALAAPAVLASAAVLGTAVAPAAYAATPEPSKSSDARLPAGLYGRQDPQYDGVWRQSLAFLAQDTVGVSPARPAVDWLAGQQCADGGFAAYRADPGKACDAKSGEYVDATAAAVQALAVVGGRSAAVEKGVGWLRKNQNDDGGWGRGPGNPSDANSTSAAIGALAATGKDPAEVTAGKGRRSPYDALLGLRLGCDAKAADRGAFAYTPAPSGKGGLEANDLATAAAALAATGKGYVFEPVGKDDGKDLKRTACAGGKETGGSGPGAAADAAAAYLADAMDRHDGHLLSALPGAKDQPDFGGTADAIVALAAGEHSKAAAGPLRWLRTPKNGAAAWAKGNPGALAKLVLADRSAGGDPRDFGGADLVRQLNATGPAPQDGAAGDADEKTDKKKDDDGSGMGGVWWIVGVGLVAGVGIGFLLSGRRKQQL